MKRLQMRSPWLVILGFVLVCGTGCVDGSGPDSGNLNGQIPADHGVCGDGACTDTETFFSCRDDCGPPNFVACFAENCSESWEPCLASQECVDSIECIVLCGDDVTCADSCYLQASTTAKPLLTQLQECGYVAQCFDAPSVTSSCPGECGEFVAGADCQCDNNCAVMGDCCEGYEAVCVAPDTCGDDQCQSAAGENSQNCPADCGEPTGGLEQCALDRCYDAVAACDADSGCAEMLPCLWNCENSTTPNCARQCIKDSGQNQSLKQLVACLEGTGCLEGEPGTGSVCGNGKCEDGENDANCAEDCEGAINPKNELMECAQEECSEQMAACLAEEACANVINCINACPENNLEECAGQCLQQGGGGFSMPSIQLGICIQSNGCLEAGSNGPGNNGPGDPPPTCGDGQCQPWENPGNCAEDCDEEEDPPENCVEAMCGAQLEACYSNQACGTALQCFSNCPQGDDACYSDCWAEAGNNSQLEELAECNDKNCSGPEGYCGDDICSDNESVNNCPEDCDEGGGGSDCGDGKCDDSESAESCPIDCGDSEEVQEQYYECLEEECKSEWDACEDSDSCDDALECIMDCDVSDEGCVDKCVDEAGFGGWWQLNALGGCAEQSPCQSILTGAGGGDGGNGGNNQSITQCLDDACGDEVKACYEDEACLDAYECLAECGGQGGQCIGKCMQDSGPSDAKGDMMQCGQQNACVGGGGGGGGGGP